MGSQEFLEVDPVTLHMTSGETRTELLAALAEVGRVHPNWRLGQMLCNLAMAAGRLDEGAVWDLEDAEVLAAARRLLSSCAETPASTA
jgi:hypothetical protein